MNNDLTDIEGVQVGHAQDERIASGVTAIVFDRPAVASASILGVLRVGAIRPCSKRK